MNTFKSILFGFLGALIVLLGIAATNQYLMPINPASWLNSALGIKQSISVNVGATTMTQASMPDNWVSFTTNTFDYSGPFLQKGNGLQIGNLLTAQGISAGVFVNEPSGMYNPLVLLAYSNSPKFIVDTGGNITANTVNASWGNFATSVTVGGNSLTAVENCTGVTVRFWTDSTSYSSIVNCGDNKIGVAFTVGANPVEFYFLVVSRGTAYPCDSSGNVVSYLSQYWYLEALNIMSTSPVYIHITCCPK
jgi:hypothetical protein